MYVSTLIETKDKKSLTCWTKGIANWLRLIEGAYGSPSLDRAVGITDIKKIHSLKIDDVSWGPLFVARGSWCFLVTGISCEVRPWGVKEGIRKGQACVKEKSLVLCTSFASGFPDK